MKTCLIDGDIICYIKESFLDVDKNIIFEKVNSYINQILYDNNYSNYEGYLGSGITFRHTLYPDYKSNRVSPKPIHYNTIKDFLINKLGFVIVKNIEVDDMISIRAKQLKDYVICHVDSDLNQIPGLHYNIRKRHHYNISEDEAKRILFKSVLKGGHNNIKGIKGIGEKKAEIILSRSNFYLLETLLEYNRVYGITKGWKEFYKNYFCNKLL